MGPLEGTLIIEIEGIGPCPFAGMMLADLGARVIRVSRPTPSYLQSQFDISHRGKQSVTLDLKSEAGKNAALTLIANADVVIEGFRPGVMERLGLGPQPCLEKNPRLVYGRMTGWGQDGPLAQRAGHDINYLALSGALYSIGRQDAVPTVPLNLVADYGGGGLVLAFGVLAALVERDRSGKGQVVDATMLDGVAALMAATHAGIQSGMWSENRGSNLLDSGAPFYDVYTTKDDKHMSVGALEPQFYARLLELLELKEGLPNPGEHLDPQTWPAIRKAFETVFKTKSRAEWTELFENEDVCVAPVLAPSEVPQHPHHQARQAFTKIDDVLQPQPAPRFSRTQTATPHSTHERGADNEVVFSEFGIEFA